uniref:Uncharacterized protein n=1 Tax=Angiostrongylus cantonensis TaxID=6313 RepID=A0A158PCG6_ANGCA
MVAPIDAQTSRCGHIVIQDQPPDRVPQMSHLVRSHFYHRSLDFMHARTLIIVLWKYRLNRLKLRKQSDVRIFVVGPPRTLLDETKSVQTCLFLNLNFLL